MDDCHDNEADFVDWSLGKMSIKRYISLGAGVQSSALLLMSDRGEIPRADVAIFSDTKAEPQEVYDWLDFLESHVSIPIIRTSAGNLEADFITFRSEGSTGLGSKSGSQLPLHGYNNEGRPMLLRRHCTTTYKISPVIKAIREAIGLKKGERRDKNKPKIEAMIGISYDEMERMRDSPIPWIVNTYPLVDLKLRRNDCSKYVLDLLGKAPPRSACYFCPYKTKKEWKELKEKSPDLFQRAVEFERLVSVDKTGQMSGEFFLNAARVPLDQIDFDETTNQTEMSFLDECEGMCGN